jgi:hypothetical protein
VHLLNKLNGLRFGQPQRLQTVGEPAVLVDGLRSVSGRSRRSTSPFAVSRQRTSSFSGSSYFISVKAPIRPGGDRHDD